MLLRVPQPVVPVLLRPVRLELVDEEPPREHPAQAREETRALQAPRVFGLPQQAVVVPGAHHEGRRVALQQRRHGREVRQKVRGEEEVVLRDDNGRRRGPHAEGRAEGELVVAGDALGAVDGLPGAVAGAPRSLPWFRLSMRLNMRFCVGATPAARATLATSSLLRPAARSRRPCVRLAPTGNPPPPPPPPPFAAGGGEDRNDANDGEDGEEEEEEEEEEEGDDADRPFAAAAAVSAKDAEATFLTRRSERVRSSMSGRLAARTAIGKRPPRITKVSMEPGLRRESHRVALTAPRNRYLVGPWRPPLPVSSSPKVSGCSSRRASDGGADATSAAVSGLSSASDS